MKNNFLKFFIIILFLIIICYGFYSSYIYYKMDDLAYIICLAIDKGIDKNLKVSVLFTNVSGLLDSSASSGSNNIIYSIEDNSLYSALNVINNNLGKQINLAHCNLLVFSEELAKEGISSEVYSLMNNNQMRSSTYIMVSKCDALKYIKSLTPDFEKLLTKYFATYDISSKYTGSFSNITLGRFYDALCSSTNDPVAILGDVLDEKVLYLSSQKESGSGGEAKDASSKGSSESSNEEEKSQEFAETIGIALFKNDVFSHELNEQETINFLAIENQISSFIASIPYNNKSADSNDKSQNSEAKSDNSKNNDNEKVSKNQNDKSKDVNNEEKSENTDNAINAIELKFIPCKNSKIKVNIENDVPTISIDLKFDADILSLDKNSNYTINDEYKKLSQEAEKYLESELKKYLEKIKENNILLHSFYDKAASNFLTQSDFNNFNWKEKYKNAKFSININVNVSSSLLLTKV